MMAKNARHVVLGVAVFSLLVFALTRVQNREGGTNSDGLRKVATRILLDSEQPTKSRDSDAGSQKKGPPCDELGGVIDLPPCPPCNAGDGEVLDTKAASWSIFLQSDSSNSVNLFGANVLIMSASQTGSSFVGRIFGGENPDAFYLFEPGLVLQMKLKSNGALLLLPIYIDMLQALYRCQAPVFYLDWLSWQSRSVIRAKAPQLYDTMCSRADTEQREGPCGIITAEEFTRTCRQKKHIVINTIRVLDIGLIAPVMDSGVNLKVIHLVRDPRGMIVSDSTMKNSDIGIIYEMEMYLTKYCSVSIDNKEVGYYLPKFSDSYHVLRVEDLALDPGGLTQKIYQFAGLGAVPDSVTKWLAENMETGQQQQETNSPTRISIQMIQSWRTVLNFETVSFIEKTGRCSEMMQHFGYLPTKDKEHLKSPMSSVLDPMPPSQAPTRYILF